MGIQIVVHVENGRVEGVYSNNPEVDVTIFDFDEYNDENPSVKEFQKAIEGMKGVS